jgi:copper(I)-binding protein
MDSEPPQPAVSRASEEDMRLSFKLALCAALTLSAAAASAHDYAKGSLKIDHPWSRATLHGAAVAAGYLAITNQGPAADRLVSVTSEIAGRVEIHEMKVEHGVAKMRPLARGLEIKPGASAKLEPGGYHLMFMDLKRPLQAGERFKGTLVFEQAGPVEVEFAVEALGAKPSNMSH